jgi:hypothetical protein
MLQQDLYAELMNCDINVLNRRNILAMLKICIKWRIKLISVQLPFAHGT